MVSPYHQSNFDSFKREISTVTNGDGSTSTTVISPLKSSSPTRKNRVLSQQQSLRKNLVDDLRTSRTQASAHRMSNKLPSLQSLTSGRFSFSVRSRVFLSFLLFRRDAIPIGLSSGKTSSSNVFRKTRTAINDD